MTHLVVRPEIDIRLLDAGAGLEAEREALDRVERAWAERMLPALDQAFDRIAGPNVHVSIDRLDLDLGAVTDLGPSLERALRDALAETLPSLRASARTVHNPEKGVETPADASSDVHVARLSETPPPHDPSEQTLAQARRQSLAQLLATGSLPWWADRTGAVDLDRAVTEALADAALVDLIERDGPHLRRLAWQARPETVTATVNAWAGSGAAAIWAAVDRWRWARRLDADGVRADAALGWIALQIAHDRATGRDPSAETVYQSVDAVAPGMLAEAAGRSVGDWLDAARQSGEGRAMLHVEMPMTRTTAPSDAVSPSDPASSETTTGTGDLRETRQQPGEASSTLPQPNAPALGRDTATPLDAAPSPGPHPTHLPAPRSRPPVGGATYVRDAGLVLLAPFLPAYLDALGVLDDGAFRSPAAQRRAVAMVAHLASGRFTHDEPETVLAKVLCGFALDAPVEREITPTAAERAEADDLLRAVVSHWTAIGATSPDALRETFLARDGRLDRTDAGWALTVERRGVDVLVDAVPWPLGLVRMDWMDAPLFVTW